MLLVVSPLAHILGAALVTVNPVSIRLVVFPLSIVDVAIGMIEDSLATGLVILPLTVILGAIRPLHRAFSMTKPALPLTIVHSPRLVSVALVLKRRVVVVPTTESFLAFFALEVLARHLAGQLQDLVLLPLQEASNEGLSLYNYVQSLPILLLVLLVL